MSLLSKKVETLTPKEQQSLIGTDSVDEETRRDTVAHSPVYMVNQPG